MPTQRHIAETRRKPATIPGMRRGALSLVLLALFLSLGWSALPSRSTARDGLLRLRDPAAAGGPCCNPWAHSAAAAATDGLGTAVFMLREDGSAIRFGDARRSSGGLIEVGLYDPLDPSLATATEAVSLPGDFRLLWLLASQAERQQLRDMATAVASGASAAFADVLRSPEFTSDYRDRLLGIVQTALTYAWQDARTQAAWAALLQAYDPILREIAARELRPILARRFAAVPLELLQANALLLVDIFAAHDWNTEPVERAVQATTAEIKGSGIPQRTLSRLLAPREATHLLRLYLGFATEAMLHSHGLMDLLAEMALDPRLRPAFAAALDPAADLARKAPRLLLSLHGSADLNLVASAALHAVLSGRHDRTVVLMSESQYQEIATLDASAPRRLLLAATP